MDSFERLSDAKLLAAARQRPAAFGVFYARCEDSVLLFFLSRGASPELAADLAAETFAAALLSASDCDDSCSSWLQGIACSVVGLSRRGSVVECRARKRLGLAELRLGPADLTRIADLEGLPGFGEGFDAQSYPALADSMRCSALMRVGQVGDGTQASGSARLPQLRAALVDAAAGHRARRSSPLAAVWRRAALLMAAVLLLAAAPAEAARPPTAERQAIDAFNAAMRSVTSDKKCQPQLPNGSDLHGSPGSELLGTFDVLNHPAAPEDAKAAESFPRLLPGDVYVDYVRGVTAADGRKYWVVPARSTPFPTFPDSCVARVHRAIRREIKGKPRRIRLLAVHFYKTFVSDNRRAARRKPFDTVFMFAQGGGGGGGGRLSFIRDKGMFGSSGTRSNSSNVSALIPNGVATIDLTFGRVHPRGLSRKPRRYRSVIRMSVPVKDNVVSFTVARSAEDAFPSKQVWRDANGNVVKVVDDLP